MVHRVLIIDSVLQLGLFSMASVIEELNRAIRERELIINNKRKELDNVKNRYKNFTQQNTAKKALFESIRGEEKVLADLRNRLSSVGNQTAAPKPGNPAAQSTQTTSQPGNQFIDNLQKTTLPNYQQNQAQYIQALKNEFNNYQGTIGSLSKQLQTLHDQTVTAQQREYQQFVSVLQNQQTQVGSLEQRSQAYREQQRQVADALSNDYETYRKDLKTQQEGATLQFRKGFEEQSSFLTQNFGRSIARANLNRRTRTYR